MVFLPPKLDFYGQKKEKFKIRKFLSVTRRGWGQNF